MDESEDYRMIIGRLPTIIEEFRMNITTFQGRMNGGHLQTTSRNIFRKL